MTANPFNKTATAPAAPVPPTAPTAAPNAAPTAPTAAPTPEAAPTGKRPRKTPNRQMSIDERKFVVENYSKMDTNEIARQLNLTRQQVYRTVYESRKTLQERLKNLNEAADFPEKAQQIEKIQKILDLLPSKPFGGGGNAGGHRKSAVETAVDALLQDMKF